MIGNYIVTNKAHTYTYARAHRRLSNTTRTFQFCWIFSNTQKLYMIENETIVFSCETQ